MRYEPAGPDTSAVEVSNISRYGIWLLMDDRELFLPYEKFPWFQAASIMQVINVKLVSPQHLYWPELDVDLEVESVLNPELYPLVSRVHEEQPEYAVNELKAEWDEKKVDECVLALLQLTLHDGVRAWKGFSFEVMDRLFEQGYISDPHNNAKSVVLTEKGLVRSEALFEEMFGGKGRGGNK